MNEYRQQLTSQGHQQDVQLQNTVKQQAQQIETLTAENTALNEQIAALSAQAEGAPGPTSITPTVMPDGGTAVYNALVKAFEELKNAHALSLERSYNTQKQAGCSQQMLLDGENTITYAQVVRRFTSQHTAYDIMKSDSLVTPYIAELKVPFQEEIRTGSSESACKSANFQQFPTPKHHEFGGYYGYWTIQYVYKDGKWQLKPTVIEKNRALYDKAYQVGSPDHAKFVIDYDMFPEFKQ